MSMMVGKRKEELRSSSEFGRGLVLPLVKFVEHIDDRMADSMIFIATMYLPKSKADRALMLSSNPPDHLDYGFPYMEHAKNFEKVYIKVWGDEKKARSSMITLWANGASDHLYDIRVPAKLKGTDIGKKILLLQSLCLDMGHGKGLFNTKVYTFKDFLRLRKLAEEIALMIDKDVFHIKDADLGKW
jgi:hypothetical protein